MNDFYLGVYVLPPNARAMKKARSFMTEAAEPGTTRLSRDLATYLAVLYLLLYRVSTSTFSLEIAASRQFQA